MKILFFDTETTGLPRDYKASSHDVENWPRLVQLSWIVSDGEGNQLKQEDFIVKPSGFTIPEDAAAIHRISTERALSEGKELKDVIDRFLADVNEADIVVGHNVGFDKKIVGAELVRLGMDDVMDEKKSICTLRSTIDFCALPGKNGHQYKFPNLRELHTILFGHSFEDAHNSLCDITATFNCFWELIRRGVLAL